MKIAAKIAAVAGLLLLLLLLSLGSSLQSVREVLQRDEEQIRQLGADYGSPGATGEKQLQIDAGKRNIAQLTIEWWVALVACASCMVAAPILFFWPNQPKPVASRKRSRPAPEL